MTAPDPRAGPRAPRWLAALLAAERALLAAATAVAAAREELAFALVPPARRDAVNAALYARQPKYRASGAHARGGLFDWEREALAAPPFPAGGRALVGGAGSGREAAALASLGWSVLAFDPSPGLVAEGRRLLGGLPGVALVEAAYADLETAARGLGPLAAPLADLGVPDAIVFGWGSFTHLADEAAQLGALAATRRLAPAAPVLVSFMCHPAARPAEPYAMRVRRPLRRLLRALGAGAPPAAGETFQPFAGFAYTFTAAEVRDLAERAGYEVRWLRLAPYAHAALAPRPHAGPVD